MRWQKSTIGIRDASEAVEATEKIEAEDEEITHHDSTSKEREYITFPQHVQESPSPVDGIEEKSDAEYYSNETDNLDVTNDQDDLFNEPSDLWIQDAEESEKNEEGRKEMVRETALEQGTLDDFVYMEPGSEPPMFNSGNGFKGLDTRSRLDQKSQTN